MRRRSNNNSTIEAVIPNIQSSLVPRRPSTRFASVEIAHSWEPLDEIGGDFLFYEKSGDRYVSLEIGDVTGHGIYSGLIMTALHGLMFGHRRNLTAPEVIMANANAFLCRLRELQSSRDPHSLVRMMMCSLFILRVDFDKRVVTYCNAGHPPPLYVTNDATVQTLKLGSRNLILGVKPTAIYRAFTLRPAAGDTLLLFTDGISEATNEADAEFGVDRLDGLLCANKHLKPREIIDCICTAMTDFRGTRAMTDDAAMAVLQFGTNW
jgi:phosphoserine phosphatase RsbU/P